MNRIIDFFSQDFWTISLGMVFDVPKEYYFLSFVLCLAVLTYFKVRINKLNGTAIYCSLFVGYSIWVFSLAVLSRSSGVTHKLNLQPFSSWVEAASNYYMLYEIVLNVAMFVPVGFLLFRMKYNFIKTQVISIIIASIIEIAQFVMRKGLCEIDDLISAFIGASVGYFAGKIFVGIKNRRVKS